MFIKCLHGYFQIYETRIGQISNFVSRYGLEIVSVGEYYTFNDIAAAPNYSLKNKPILGNSALVNFEGKPWEVFEKNGLIYDFSRGLVVPINSITQQVVIDQSGNKFISNGLIKPGSLTAAGQRVKDYSAWFYRDTLTFEYSEVGYV